MPFFAIRGKYHVKGYSPDGDSIRFEADDPAHWDLLDGPPAKVNARGHAQLRLEAIDTLETHFKNTHQPMALAKAALDHLLDTLGITGVVWNAQGTVITNANDGVSGYILSREVERNRRPIAFAYAGALPEANGSSVFLDAARIKQSLNAEMLRSGLAYPTYYKGLFSSLRTALTELTAEARQAARGVWPHDRTNAGFVVNGLQSLEDDHVILPKLFRRLADFLEAGGTIDGFKDFLADLAEGMIILSTAHATHFDTVVDVDVATSTVRMTQPPENLMFEG